MIAGILHLIGGWIQFCLLVSFAVLGSALPAGAAARGALERSFWLHASMAGDTRMNYWGTNFPAPLPPSKQEVQNAARLLTKSYAASRLYLIYHRELPAADARRIFLWWRKACPRNVELVPTLVLSMYDRAQTPVFSKNELIEWIEFFGKSINARSIAVYDVYPRPQSPEAVTLLARRFPSGLIRVGLQPGESLESPFTGAVEDTWSAMCHGKDNERDWREPGFGAETLRKWVLERNAGEKNVAWDLIVVAWDYSATERGSYPGYDDAKKNMPLPAGRNRAAMQLIRETAEPKVFAGFSSDLFILHANSRSTPHDGTYNSFYECLKRGEDYRGYYVTPFHEIVTLYRELRDQKQ